MLSDLVEQYRVGILLPNVIFGYNYPFWNSPGSRDIIQISIELKCQSVTVRLANPGLLEKGQFEKIGKNLKISSDVIRVKKKSCSTAPSRGAVRKEYIFF